MRQSGLTNFKTLLPMVAVWLFPLNASAMNTYLVGEPVSGKSYNEIRKDWINRNFSIWVGVSENGGEYVLFSGDTGLGQATVPILYTAEEINNLEQLLVTVQEWARIARANHADVDKVLSCFPESYFKMCDTDGIPHEKNQMGLRFYSSNSGQHINLIIDMTDQNNEFKRATIYLNQSDIPKLTKNIQQISAVMKKAKEASNKQHLFQLPSKSKGGD